MVLVYRKYTVFEKVKKYHLFRVYGNFLNENIKKKFLKIRQIEGRRKMRPFVLIFVTL